MFFRRSFVFNLCTQNKNQYRSKYEWVAPVGHDTGIKVYNEIVKKKVPLVFPNPKYVKWYMCGPTVYDASHIGHASCYIRCDIIRRVLMEYYNINAVVAIGVTNVSEKIFQRSIELEKSPKLVAEKYELEFFTQMKELNILPPSFILRVKDYLPVISKFILKLVDKGAAYKTVDGSVYFKTAFHPNYGRFKTPVVDDTEEKVVGRLSPLDFALWKSTSNKADKNHSNRGLPGWHIQCSAMASHVFGESLDIHSGGADLIFPHHENEESQSTSYHDCQQWVNYWLHTGLINMGENKMSKSLNNYIPISNFLQTNSSNHLRMFCMMTPYRNNLNYDQRTIVLASNICDRLIRFFSVSDSYMKGTWLLGNVKEAELLEEMEKSHNIIMNHLSNDFECHEALKCILALIKTAMRMLNEDVKSTTSRSPAVIASLNQYVHKFFKSFGFVFAENESKQNETPSAIEALVDATMNFRMKVREKAISLRGQQQKQLMALCDETRDNLRSVGVIINDLTPSHTHWSLKESKLNNGSMIKNVIDVLVWFRSEVQKLIPFLSSSLHQNDFLEICRCTKMHLSTLGVIIDDFEDGRSGWSFPAVDDQASSKYEVIINSTVKFYDDVRRIAMSITNENSSAKAKKDLLELCETATSNLKSFGVIVNHEDQSNPDWMLEVNNNKGKSIVQNVMDMLMGSRDQVKSLSLLAQCEETRSKLDNICYKTRKFLTNYGLNILDPYDRNSPTKWRVVAKGNKKVVLDNVLDILVMFMNDIRKAAEELNDAEMRKILLEICYGLEKDLREIGVTLVTEDKKLKWTFKECQSLAEI